jgi:hypothetical protein
MKIIKVNFNASSFPSKIKINHNWNEVHRYALTNERKIKPST